MDVRLPDGTLITDVPEGTTQSELMGRMAKMQSPPPASPSSQLPSPTSSNPIDRWLVNTFASRLAGMPDIQASAPGRFIQGMADLPIGAMQLGMNLLGAGSLINPAVSEINQTTQALRGPDAGFDWARLAGNVSNPVLWGLGNAIPAATGYFGKVGQGMGIGALSGAIAPVENSSDFWPNKALQTAGGAAIGGAIPGILSPIGNIFYHGLIEPWAAPETIKGRAYLEAAGNKIKELVQSLRENRQIVPGSIPTAGEAAVPAGRAEFSALQKSASNVLPSSYLERSDLQNAARLDALKSIAQDKTALENAVAIRRDIAGPLYEQVESSGASVDKRPVVSMIDKMLGEKPGNKPLVIALTNVRDSLSNAETPGQVSSALDNIKALISSQDNAFIRKELGQIKDVIKNQIDKVAPIGAADIAFAGASGPINRMQIGQYLEQKLTPALDESAKQKAGTFAQALRDAPQTIKRSTGFPRYDELTQILKPEDMAVVNGIREDLARTARFELMAAKGSRGGPNALDLATASLEREAGGQIPNILHRGAMITNAIIGRLQGKVNAKLASEIAAEMLNPATVADSLERAALKSETNKIIAERIRNFALPALSGGMGAGARISTE